MRNPSNPLSSTIGTFLDEGADAAPLITLCRVVRVQAHARRPDRPFGARSEIVAP
jgi:hypothetical protein